MLQIHPNCQCCDKDLPPESTEAMICSFECTFCESCAFEVLDGVCPNCAGNFARRPIRPSSALERYPASNQRIPRSRACA